MEVLPLAFLCVQETYFGPPITVSGGGLREEGKQKMGTERAGAEAMQRCKVKGAQGSQLEIHVWRHATDGIARRRKQPEKSHGWKKKGRGRGWIDDAGRTF